MSAGTEGNRGKPGPNQTTKPVYPVSPKDVAVPAIPVEAMDGFELGETPMKRMILPAILVAIVGTAQTPEDDPHERDRLLLLQAGVAVNDEAALIRTLRQREKPWLATPAVHFLGKLPKSELGVGELNIATLSDDEFVALYTLESLLGWGDRQWVSSARSRLPSFKNQGVRLSVAGLLARAGVFDGWNTVEPAIMAGDGRYRRIALMQVNAFRDMKELSGQPFNLVAKLDSMRSSSSSKAVRDALLNKITQLTRQPPAQSIPRK